AEVEYTEGEVKWGAVEDSEDSILGKIGSVAAPVFKPLGFGDWKPTVATVMGLVAKEEVVGVFGVLYGTDTDDMDTFGLIEEGSDEDIVAGLSPVAEGFNETSGGYGQIAAFAFMLFNLLCAPCFAAIGAIKREMNNAKWTWFAIAYQCGLAYAVSLIVYQLGRMFAGGGFGFGPIVAIVLLAGIVYLLVRKNKYDDNHLTQKI
ncbi:MAG: ferrous iron transporter B, partial [Clostridia bacterium]|nr:ferrous iron transporter B [Clostridia bacterium]